MASAMLEAQGKYRYILKIIELFIDEKCFFMASESGLNSKHF